MIDRTIPEKILAFVEAQGFAGLSPPAASAITAHVGSPRPTVNRHLKKLVDEDLLVVEGTGPATRYRRSKIGRRHSIEIVDTARAYDAVSVSLSPTWSGTALALRDQLQAPLGTRSPVTYQRKFVDDYRPNQTSLLPPEIASSLFTEGRMPGQQPAGTYARRVLEPLLIDLSWASSKLEGNRKSLLETRDLFQRGRSVSDDQDATMLLNHKDAIEFMVDAVPTYGISVSVVRNLHSLLMQGLLANSESLGAIRRTIVNISDTAYLPTQVPTLLEEMLEMCVGKARATKNPLEAAFFLWVNLAYLQPFEDGNKRTSRLAANLPLMLSNCAPLSFIDVDSTDYVLAMLGVYERLDVTLAVELFAWAYRHSIPRYRTTLEAMGTPNPFRTKYREPLISAMQQVIAEGTALSAVLAGLHIPAEEEKEFKDLVNAELRLVEPYNCARYRLPIGKTEDWIAAGRTVK